MLVTALDLKQCAVLANPATVFLRSANAHLDRRLASCKSVSAGPADGVAILKSAKCRFESDLGAR